MRPGAYLAFNIVTELVLAVVSTGFFVPDKLNVVLVPATTLTAVRKENFS